MDQSSSVSPEMFFMAAFDAWISTMILRKPGYMTDARYIAPKTEKEYRQFASALHKMFAKLRLADIHLGHLREYQRARAFCDGPWKAAAGANLIRKEVGMLIRMMRAAGCWNHEEMKKVFRTVQCVEADVQRAMTPDEQEHFLAVAGSRERWHYIRNYAVAALQTTCSTGEMRKLRLGDVMLEPGIVQIRREGAKNKYRIRTIPIETQECRWAFEALKYRAVSLGCSSPQHFLFPAMDQRDRTYDPTKAMGDTALRGLWDEVRDAAGMPWLRPNYMRHTAISRMAESGVPIQVILSFAGHVSLKMQQHYTTISVLSQRKAVSATWGKSAPPYMMGITPHNNGFSLAKKTS